MRKVVRIETAAISSGTRARNEAKTNSSTAKAPRAPISVSASTLGPDESPPAESSSYDVSPTSMPEGFAARCRTGSSFVSRPGPKPDGGGPCTRPKVVAPSVDTNRSSPVEA